MSSKTETALVEALDLLDQGLSVDEIVARYPEMAPDLRPLLAIEAELHTLARPASTTTEQASRQEFLRYASTLNKTRRAPSSAGLRRLLASGLAFLLLLSVAGATILVVSGMALPGDTLYGAKLQLEDMRLNYSANPEAAAALIEGFRQERRDEIAALLTLGRSEPVTFGGEIEVLTPDRWVVSGIPVAVNLQTSIQGTVDVGLLVQVHGTTAGALVKADQIEVLNGHLPVPDRRDLLPPETLPTADPEKVEPPEPSQTSQPDDGPLSVTPQPPSNGEDDGFSNEDGAVPESPDEDGGGRDQGEEDRGAPNQSGEDSARPDDEGEQDGPGEDEPDSDDEHDQEDRSEEDDKREEEEKSGEEHDPAEDEAPDEGHGD